MSHSSISGIPMIACPTHLQHGSLLLLQLPLELQLIIYGYCLTIPAPIVDPGVSHHCSWYKDPESHRNPALPLLLVCRQTYYTVLAAGARSLYADNRFHFTTITRMSSFLGRLPPHHSTLIAHISISLDGIMGWSPNQLDEWLQYLADDLAGGGQTSWSKALDSLKTTTPNLKSLLLILDGEGISPFALDRRVVRVAKAMVNRIKGLGLDKCVVACPVADLRISWKGLEEELHVELDI